MSHQPENPQSERRLHEREPAQGQAYLRILNPVSDKRAKVEIIEQSAGGVAVLCSTEVAPGSAVQLRLKDWLVSGEVRHCTPHERRFRLGIRIDELLPVR